MNRHSIRSPNILELLTTHIQQLASQDQLVKLDAKLKKKFADHFPIDIPHVCDLPNDVYHHIKVKPGVSISTAHAYSCPHKYR